MTLINAGIILADGSNALVIDTGSNVVTNTGLLEASGSGGLVVDSALDNTGNVTWFVARDSWFVGGWRQRDDQRRGDA